MANNSKANAANTAKYTLPKVPLTKPSNSGAQGGKLLVNETVGWHVSVRAKLSMVV
jgi:hypothetical protein